MPRPKGFCYYWEWIGKCYEGEELSLIVQCNQTAHLDCVRVVCHVSGEELLRYWLPRGYVRSLTPEVLRMGIEQLLAKAKAQTAQARAVSSAAEGEEAKRWPLIMELLCTAEMPDGSVREVSKLTIRRDATVWQAGLTEPQLQASAWASGSSIVGALDALERRLASNDDQVWRRWQGNYQGSQKGKKRG